MAVSTFGPAAGAAGAALPINALEKVYEAYSADGYFEYSPAGGVPAGKYILEVEGSNVDYIEAVGKGQTSKGKSGRCYLEVQAGGSISATASAFGDSTVAATAITTGAPHFTSEWTPGDATYSFSPGERAAISPTGNWVTIFGLNGQKSLETSTNGVAWTWQKDNSIYAEAEDVMSGINYNASQFIGDVKWIGNYWYATLAPVNASTGLYRSSDPAGAAGTWTLPAGTSTAYTSWSLSGTPGLPNRVVRGYNGGFAYSDNNGASWTQASSPDTGSNGYQITIAGSEMYAIQSNRYYSGGINSYISKSTNNGQSWSLVYNWGTSWFPLSIANKPGTTEWVAIVKDNSNYIYTSKSTDGGASWSSTLFTTNTSLSSYNKVIWSDVANGFLFAASDGNAGNIYYSATGGGGTWNLWRSTPGNALVGLAENNGKVIYYSYNSKGLYWTDDGVTFNESTTDFTNIRGVAYAGGNYFLSNASANILKGPSLDNLSLTYNGKNVGSMVAFGDNILGKISNTSNYAYSIDGGTTWSNGINNGMYGAPCFTDGKFFRIDNTLTLWSSLDLVSWTQHTTFSYGYRFIRKIGFTYFAYGSSTSSDGYAVSTDLSNWKILGGGVGSAAIWGVGLDESSGWYFAQIGNGSTRSSRNPFAGYISDSTYGTSLQGPAYQTSSSPISNSTYGYDGVEAGGVGWLFQGFVSLGKDYSTTNSDMLRYYAGTTSGEMVAYYDKSYLNQPAIGLGKVTSVNPINYKINQFSYGKPASIAIYKMKEEV